MKVQKDILREVSAGVAAIVVTGTNGKTTTARMVEHALTAAGCDVLANKSGANLLSGVTAEFAAAADWRGRPVKKYAVIECDEGALHLVAPLLRPKVIVVTNLFRDQLDRYGEVMHTLEAIRAGIREVPETVLCLNADDSLVASLAAEGSRRILWFGLETEIRTGGADSLNAGAAAEIRQRAEGTSPGAGKDASGAAKGTGRNTESPPSEAELSDARYCIRCGTQYRYHFHTYAHLGDFYCPACGYARHRPDVAVTSIDRISAEGTDVHMRIPAGRRTKEKAPFQAAAAREEPTQAVLPRENPAQADSPEKGNPRPACVTRLSGQAAVPAGDIPVRIGTPAVYNVYNAAAAVSACLAAGFPQKTVLSSLEGAAGSFGRMETFDLDGVRVQMILVKNPAGCNQALEYLCAIREPFAAVLCLNDLDADGHDISWIWDVDYEKLCEDSFLKKVYVWGIRAEDMQLRLKYAGAEESSIELVKEMDALVAKMRRSKVPVFVLPNYTTMLPLRDALSRATGKEAFWAG